MSEQPVFGEMHESLAYRQHLHAVRDEQAIARRAPVTMRTSPPAFEGTYPHTGGDKVAGFKNPPPPGGSQ